MSFSRTGAGLCIYHLSNLDIVCDTSTGKIRPFVPESFQCVFFSSLYNLSHPGMNASIKLMTEICMASDEVGYSTVGKNLRHSTCLAQAQLYVTPKLAMST